MINIIIFKVDNYKLHIKHQNGWMTRPAIIISMLTDFVLYYNIKTIPETIIDIADASGTVVQKNKFAISLKKTDKQYIVPDPHSLMWPELNIPNVFNKFKVISEAGCIPPIHNVAFWIGQNCHESRRCLIKVAKQHPDKINASFLEWPGGIVPVKYVPLEDHTHYKYLIDCSGQGFSGRVKYLLHTRRLLFLLDREYWDWITCDLEAWVHYVPVKEDASDLLEKIQWADDNPEEVDKIIKNAYSYITTNLTLPNIYKRLYDVLDCK